MANSGYRELVESNTSRKKRHTMISNLIVKNSDPGMSLPKRTAVTNMEKRLRKRGSSYLVKLGSISMEAPREYTITYAIVCLPTVAKHDCSLRGSTSS